MTPLFHCLIYSGIVYFTCRILPGIEITDLKTALITSVLLGIVNCFIKPILEIIALPVASFTLGLIVFVINAGILMLMAFLIEGFSISSFWWALFASLIITILNKIYAKYK